MRSADFFVRMAQQHAVGPTSNIARVKPVFECTKCECTHEDEEDAESCCPPDSTLRCPVCQIEHDEIQEAADCCLHTHPTMTAAGRALVAQAVASGTPWPDAIAQNAAK